MNKEFFPQRPDSKPTIYAYEELIVVCGGKVQAFYPYVMRQQWLEGITSLGVFMISVIIFIIGLKLETENDCQPILKWFLIGIGGFMGLVSFLYLWLEGFLKLFNPNFYAVQAIIEIGSKLIK